MPAWISSNLVSLLVFIALAGPTYIFFGRHEIALGLIDILALWATIAGLAIAAWPVNQWASLLFIPYLLWVTFAAALNAPIWLRTPAAA